MLLLFVSLCDNIKRILYGLFLKSSIGRSYTAHGLHEWKPRLWQLQEGQRPMDVTDRATNRSVCLRGRWTTLVTDKIVIKRALHDVILATVAAYHLQQQSQSQWTYFPIYIKYIYSIFCPNRIFGGQRRMAGLDRTPVYTGSAKGSWAGKHSRHNPVFTEQFIVMWQGGGGGIRALLTAPVWTEFRYLHINRRPIWTKYTVIQNTLFN